MARLLIIGDLGSHTGFSTVTQNIGDRLALDHGWDVHTLAINWRGDHVDTPQKMYLPTQIERMDIHGRSRYIELLGKLVPDVVLLINDPAVVINCLLENPWDRELAFWRGISNGEVEYKVPIVAYLPIDGYHTPRSWDILKERMTRVAMTHFGQQTMTEAPVIWHGVDTGVFEPIDKTAAKRSLGLDPDRFLILRVDKNSSRKDYPATWRALSPVLRKYTDIDVIFHCQERPGGIDYDLAAYRWNDEDIRDRVAFSNVGGYLGWPEDRMPLLYSAADLFVTTSHGEGFGLSILEAMACGTPVIATDCSAITEVVGDGGVLIPPGDFTPVPQGQDQVLPDIPAFSAAIEHLYHAGGVRRKLGKAAVKQASKFSWDIAAAKFHDVLQQSMQPPNAAKEEEQA